VAVPRIGGQPEHASADGLVGGEGTSRRVLRGEVLAQLPQTAQSPGFRRPAVHPGSLPALQGERQQPVYLAGHAAADQFRAGGSTHDMAFDTAPPVVVRGWSS